MVIETDTTRAVPWMSPTDDGAESLLRLTEKSTTTHKGGCHALFADGAVRFVPTTEPADTRQSMITATAGDKSSTD
jgi:prepilin-type processing-associated H-X9-DG protein